MNRHSFEIIEDSISFGRWTWLELDKNSNSLYLEFENLQLLSKSIANDYKPIQESRDNDYRGELAIRFAGNVHLSFLYDDKASFAFLDLKDDSLLDSDIELTDIDSYFYREFSQDIRKFKFQDIAFSNDLREKYENEKVLIDIPKEKDNYDFLLSFELEDFAIIVKGDLINCFNDFESLDDEAIKRSSNDWILYYLDYIKKKGSSEEYKKDLLCENFSL